MSISNLQYLFDPASVVLAFGCDLRVRALRRFRPVMMTASITGFGLIPLLLATGPGSEIQRPLAIVVIGGLVSATMLTLIILPILFQRYGVPVRDEKLP